MTESNGAATPRPLRLLVLNQYYWPGIEATATLLSELCASLAPHVEVTVISGRLRHRPTPAGRFVHDGVRIIRVNSTAFERVRMLPRASNYLTYLTQSLSVALREPRPDVVLCMTDPPVIANVALVVARRFRAPLVVISQDVFPEIAVELGRLEHPVLVALLRRLIRTYLTRADHIVAIGDTMRRRLEHKGTPPARISVIPNWVDTESLTPRPRVNAWAAEHDLVGKFVVMHSGNIGYAHNLDNLVRAATLLRDLDDLSVVIIGHGAKYHEIVALAERLEATNVRFLPYQPREKLAESLSSADVHFVGLAPGLSGFVVPSRLYGILSVGRPVIVAADAESETAQVVNEQGCGVVIPAGVHTLLAQEIRNAYAGVYPLDEMGARGRGYVTREADRRVAVERYRKLLLSMAA